MDYSLIQKKAEQIWKTHPTYVVLGVFAVLVLLFYGNTLFNGFVMDDQGQIERNQYIRSLEYLPKVVTSCIWEAANRGCYGKSFYYRPVHFLSYILTYQIGSSPAIFHLVNLFYFFAIVSLLYILSKLLTKNALTAFLAALIFLVHPINSEVVNWVSAVPELTFAIFVLLSTILYVQYREQKSQTGSQAKLLLVYFFYSLSILSKEPAILLPIVFVALDVFHFKFRIRDLLRGYEIKRYLFFAVPFLVYFFARKAILGTPTQFGSFTVVERFHAMVTLFSQYVMKMLNPYPLSAFSIFEKQSDIFTLSFLIALSVGILFVVAFLWSVRRKLSVVSVAMVWFLVFLSPVLIILGGVGDNVFSERYLFVPGIGVALVGGYAASHIIKRYKLSFKMSSRTVVIISAVSLLGVGMWHSTFQRNTIWHDPETLLTRTIQQLPDAHDIRWQLGDYYNKNGEYEKAKFHFEEIIRRGPEWKNITMAYKGLGDYYSEIGDDENTLLYYQQAAYTSSRSPRDYIVYSDIAALAMNKDHYLRGFVNFCQSVALLQDNPEAQNNANIALSLVQTEYIDTNTLFQATREQLDAFPFAKIIFAEQRCLDDDTCEYAFALQPDPRPEILPPFLITAATESGDYVEITNQTFNPDTNVIILETSDQYQDQSITFLFPTCQGFYYEAVAAAKNRE